MKEMRFSSFVDAISTKNEDVVFITSVNYEQRSLEWLKVVKNILFQSTFKKNLNLYRLKIENTRTISILNHRIESQELELERQIKLIREMMEKENNGITLNLSKCPLSLGRLPEVEVPISELRAIANSGKPFQIIFDITALPRRILLLYMDAYVKLVTKGIVSSIYIVYTWPLRYPIAGRSTNTGSLRIENSNSTFSEFINEADEVHGIMTAGRDGSIGRLFLESIGKSNRVDTFFYVKKDDYLFALSNMLNNSDVLSRIDSSTTINYYLSISRGYEVIMKKIKDILDRWSSSNTGSSEKVLLIAPLGPKPMVITAFMGSYYAEEFFKRNGLKFKSGITHVTSLQQNDLYSIGSKETSVYKLNIDDIQVE